VPRTGRCSRVSYGPCRAFDGHDVAVPFFIAHFFISNANFSATDVLILDIGGQLPLFEMEG
jgi:hypothetical protein